MTHNSALLPQYIDILIDSVKLFARTGNPSFEDVINYIINYIENIKPEKATYTYDFSFKFREMLILVYDNNQTIEIELIYDKLMS